MSEPIHAPALDADETSPPNKLNMQLVSDIAGRILLVGAGLLIGAVSGLLVGLVFGLIPISC